MTNRLIPRLTAKGAEIRLTEIQDAVTAGVPIESLVNLDPREAIPNSTGGQAATDEDLQQCRSRVRGAVQAPSTTPGKDGRDLHGIQLGRALCEVINPLPSDAGHEGVWSFLSLYVFPDIVWERWTGEVHDGERRLPPDRWIGAQAGRDRNYLKASWYRWSVLGDVMETADPPLGEDEFLNLLERTAVARNRRLVVAAARAVSRHDSSHGGRMDFTRELMKAISYQTGARSLDLLSDEEIEALVEDQAAKVRSLQGARRAAPAPDSSLRSEALGAPAARHSSPAASPVGPAHEEKAAAVVPRRGFGILAKATRLIH